MNIKFLFAISCAVQLVGCAPMGIDIKSTDGRWTEIDTLLNRHGGLCQKELQNVFSSPPPAKPIICSLNESMPNYLFEISKNRPLHTFLIDNLMNCSKEKNRLISCNSVRVFHRKPFVDGQPEYPVTTETFKIIVRFHENQVDHPSDISVSVFSTIPN